MLNTLKKDDGEVDSGHKKKIEKKTGEEEFAGNPVMTLVHRTLMDMVQTS